jgi:enoyl-CoA hydratase
MAKELLWSGRTIEADEAQRLGLVNVVCGLAALEETVAALAARIAKAPPLAVRLSKRCVDQGVASSREGAMAIELAAIEQNLRASDWKRAIENFGRNDDDR